VADRLRQAERDGGPVVRVIFDLPGEFLAEATGYTAALAEQLADPMLVGMGMGGPEVDHPRSAAAPYFERVRRAGYPVVSHAGETGPAEHVRQAIVELKAKRVQHGVHAVDDPEVLQMLVERSICCDVALTSNLLLTTYRDLKSHPLKQMVEAGVPVTINTDDPAFFNTDLNNEYELAHREIGLSLDQLWDINLNGLRFGLAETALRRRLMCEFIEAGEQLGLTCSS
jgi:aminodeoxyfutalosine deaminase